MQEKNKFILQQSIIIFCLTILFTIIVFLIKNYYFSAAISQEEIEENYIEPTVIEYIKETEYDIFIESNSGSFEDGTGTGKQVLEIIEEHYTSASPFTFSYFPDKFEKKSENFASIFSTFLQSKNIKNMIFDLDIHMHEDLLDVRGKMKNRAVKLFGYSQEKESEYYSVAVHELAHFIDIYFLEKKVFQDISEQFYNISWEETKVIIPGQSQSDFVSGYAMTNKYEDFAESFTYYILHNDDFLRKTLESDKLNKKYDFFKNILFKNIFKDTDFSIDNTVEDYYRDITKIDIDIEKLLQYLKNGI